MATRLAILAVLMLVAAACGSSVSPSASQEDVASNDVLAPAAPRVEPAPAATAAPTTVPTAGAPATAVPTTTPTPMPTAIAIVGTPPSIQLAGTTIDLAPLMEFVEMSVGRSFERVPSIEVLAPDQRGNVFPSSGLFVTDRLWQLFLALGLVGVDDDQTAADQARVDRVRGICCPLTLFDISDPVLAEIVIVHELTHQIDEQVPLGEPAPNPEIIHPVAALYEGNAHRVAFNYAAVLEAQGSIVPEPPAIFEPDGDPRLPDPIQQVLEFPYDEGRSFSIALQERGGQQLLDEAFARVPSTTEQILDVDAYLADEQPLDVAAPEPPVGAQVFDSGSLGAFVIRLMANSHLGAASSDEQDASLALATAWDGDSYVLFAFESKLCISAVVAMDDAAAAESLIEVMRGISDTVTVEPDGASVALTNCVAQPDDSESS